MSLRNKLAIVSFTLMSLMTIPTLAENDNAPVTSRIEDALHTVEIKVPEGWQETKSFELIPESFELWGSVFKGVKFKNGTEHHGCAIFFASDMDDEEDDLDDDDDDIVSDAALARAVTHVQEKAFPDAELSSFKLMKWNLEGNVQGDSETITKAAFKGNLEGNLAKKSGESMKVSVTGRIDSHPNNFAIGTGRITLGDAMPLYGATGVLISDKYDIIMISWGADEAILEKDLNVFKDAIAITPKPAKVKPVVTRKVEAVVVGGELTQIIVVAETAASVEETKQIVAEPTPALEEKKQDVVASEPVAVVAEATPVAAESTPALEEKKQDVIASEPVVVEASTLVAAEPAQVLEEKNVSSEPVAATEVTAPAETAVAVETAQAAVASEPVNTAETQA